MLNLKKERKIISGRLLLTLLCLVLLAAFTIYVNRDTRIRALYMDDLYMWSCYGEQGILEFSFPFRSSTRFRPVYWLLAWLEMALVGPEVTRFAAFNILTNMLLVFTVFGIAKKLSGSRLTALSAGLAFAASRFAYYQIGQVLGFMETLASFFALLMLYFLLRYLHTGNDPAPGKFPCTGRLRAFPSDERFFGAALFFYCLLSLTHERYLPQAALFYLVLFLKIFREKKEDRKAYFLRMRRLWLRPASAFALLMLLRFIFIGKAMPAGTGGTEVTETFSIAQTLRFCLSQVYYLLGINDGPDYLCGLPWENTPAAVKTAVKGSILLLGLLFILWLADLAKDLRSSCAERKSRFRDGHFTAFVFAAFAVLCILSSSCTIRVEMRWIYVTFGALLLFAAYMAGYCRQSLAEQPERTEPEKAGTEGSSVPEACASSRSRLRPASEDRPLRAAAAVPVLLAVLYAALSAGTNLYCRSRHGSLYFMEGQQRANSIAEQTVEKYGAENVLGKTVYLLNSSFEISDFYCRYFFRPFDPEKTGQGTCLVRISDLSEAEDPDCIILEEVPGTRLYRVVEDR